jgi:phosphate uptake regulator
MITLPKDWAESRGLKKNDSVSVEVQSDGDLLISPVKKSDVPKNVKKINVTNPKNDESLYRQLIGAYISGHSLIEVSSDIPLSNNIVSVVNSFTQTSIGLEVVEEDNNRILIKDLIDHTEIRPNKSLERMSILVRKMISDVFEYAITGDILFIKDMEKRDVEIDRLHWLISRQNNIYKKDPGLCKRTGLTLCELTNPIAVSRILERIGDHAVLVSNTLMTFADVRKAEAADRGFKEIGKDILGLYNGSVSSWLKNDMDAAEECIEEGEKLVKKIERTFKKIDVGLDTASAAGLISGSSKRIAEYCIDISELTINVAMD